MKREIIVSISALLVLCIICGVAAANAETFVSTDVNTLLTRGICAELIAEYLGRSFGCEEQAVVIALDTGIMALYPDGLFRPEQVMRRDEFAYAMARLAGVEWLVNCSAETPFEDIPSIHWASGIIEYFVEEQVFGDEMGEYFDERRPVTLTETKLWLNRLATASR